MNDKDKLEEWKRQIEQASQYGLFFDKQTVTEMVEMIEQYQKALEKIAFSEIEDYEPHSTFSELEAKRALGIEIR